MRLFLIPAVPLVGLLLLALLSWPGNQLQVVRYVIDQRLERATDPVHSRTSRVTRFPMPVPAPAPVAAKTAGIPAAVGSGDSVAGYSVQVCAGRNRVRAGRLAASLRKQGHDVRIQTASLPGHGAWYRVRVGSYETRTAAGTAAAGLRRSRFPGAFVVPPASEARGGAGNTVAAAPKTRTVASVAEPPEGGVSADRGNPTVDGTDRRTQLLIGAARAVQAFDRTGRGITAAHLPADEAGGLHGTARPPSFTGPAAGETILGPGRGMLTARR